MTKQAKQTSAHAEPVPAFLTRKPSAQPVTKLPPAPKLKAAKTKTKPAKVGKAKAATPPAPKVAKGSVVPASWKAKAGKSGVVRQDDLDQAVRNAFLSEGNSTTTPQAAARIATDNILGDNQLESGRWAGRNAGMLSMNLRNVLRGMRRNGATVIVYGKKLGPVEA